MALTDEDKAWIEARLKERLERMETEFHKWASSLEARQRTHTAAITRSSRLSISRSSARMNPIEEDE